MVVIIMLFRHYYSTGNNFADNSFEFEFELRGRRGAGAQESDCNGIQREAMF